MTSIIYGAGYYLALLIKAEIEDVNKFMVGDDPCSYAGGQLKDLSKEDEIRRDFGYHPARHYIVIHPKNSYIKV